MILYCFSDISMKQKFTFPFSAKKKCKKIARSLNFYGEITFFGVRTLPQAQSTETSGVLGL